MKLSVAIVSYRSNPALLNRTIQSVQEAYAALLRQRADVSLALYFVDNDLLGSGARAAAEALAACGEAGMQVNVLQARQNLGYGRAHNLCLSGLDSDYHLILNPDVILAEDYLLQGLAFMEQEPDVVMVAPHVVHEDGSPAYLCKRYPAVADLFLRGFMPGAIQKRFEQRLAHYRMKDLYDQKAVSKQVPIISGCCMLLRSKAFQALGGFDESFFLYFEDFDLSIRAAGLGHVAYHPDLHIVHGGGFSSSKGFWHILQFTRSGRKFFKKHGWQWV